MLPEFDQLAMDRRFLTELHRLQQAGAFDSYRQLAPELDTQPSFRVQIESGRYHCNLRLLYNLKRRFPQADLTFILEGGKAAGRPEPTAFPAAPKLGAPFARKASVATKKKPAANAPSRTKTT
ncbi:hypothetical protein [Hymenobacter sediminicola]|uniref:Uncharacterized protein n=1 Tax=Hymenobacter sediminicola TaxID=2761579 RepID=A0A7G7W2X0_9BACT|nr:hypothetical protein [Hymenobacter sediminicola]QNH60713.1 hypothetical protein H4317_10970 [Hymenobacter sediminicola]